MFTAVIKWLALAPAKEHTFQLRAVYPFKVHTGGLSVPLLGCFEGTPKVHNPFCGCSNFEEQPYSVFDHTPHAGVADHGLLCSLAKRTRGK